MLSRNYAVRIGEHTRLACSDRRPRRSVERVPESLSGAGLDAPCCSARARNRAREARALPIPTASLRLSFFLICGFMLTRSPALLAQPRQLLDAKVHHLGVAGKPEWQEFIGKRPEGQRLELHFQARTNRAENTLFIRQDDVKEEWNVAVNGREVGKLFQMEADLIHTISLPAGSLRDDENVLSIIPAKSGDDIYAGEIWVDARPVTEAVGSAALSVAVNDLRTGEPLPCRITVVNEADTLVPLLAAEGQRLAVRPGVAYTPNGRAKLRLQPGEYTLYATRGFEYGLASRRVRVRANEPTHVSMRIRREVLTPGWLSSDTHVHTFTLSRHGDATLEERAVTLAGEGVELPIATDHNILADYSEAVAATGTAKYFTPVVGCEVTTAKGHFNVFPIKLGSRVPDFRIEDWPPLMESIRGTPGVRVAILNHPRNIHTDFQPFAATNFNAITGENLRGPEFTFDAIELVNSSALQSDWMLNFRDWFALLNYGYRVTGVGSSDGHDVSRYIVGQGRSYVLCDDSNPGAIDIEQACRGFRDGRVLISLGLLTQMTVETGAKSFRVGDLAPVEKNFRVLVTVSAPSWIEADQVELYANGVKIREHKTSRRQPAGRPSRFDTALGVKLPTSWLIERPRHDVHLVAIATGPGVREPYWAMARPYQPTSPIWESRVIGATNPIWIDADRDGKFTSARAHGRGLVQRAGASAESLFAALADADEAVAAQAASLSRAAGSDLLDPLFTAQLSRAPAHVRKGFELFISTLPRSSKQ